MALPWGEAMTMCRDGRIVDGKTLLGLVAVDRAGRGAEPTGGESVRGQRNGGGS